MDTQHAKGDPTLIASLSEGITEQQARNFYYIPGRHLVYANNQKSGCTTIKYSLWQDFDKREGVRTFRGNTHDRDKAPFIIGRAAMQAYGFENIRGASCFSAVRSPFSRVLSVYLHHIADTGPWTRFSRRLGFWRSEKIRQDFFNKAELNPRRDISFDMFLEALQGMPDTLLLGHFRSQVFNLAWGAVPYDFVGRLEAPEQVAAYLGRHGVQMQNRRFHAQNAREKQAAFLTPSARRLIAERYCADFEAFGYRPDDPFYAPKEACLAGPGAGG